MRVKVATKKKNSVKADIDLLLHKPTGAAKLRRRTELIHRGLRWAIQIAFFIAFPAVFSASFNGVKYIFAQIGARQPIELTAFVSLLIAVLAFTCVFGRFFCGYACAFGTLGDAVYALATPLRRLLKLDRRRAPVGVQHAAQLVKYLLLAVICVLCALGTWSAVSGYSPWVSFAGLCAASIEGIAAGSFVALGVVVLGMALVERFFCQFLCPLGAVFSLLPVLPVSILRRDRARCVPRCNRCQDRCPVAIHPDRGDLRSGECVYCGRCVDGCPVANITLIKIEDAAQQTAVAESARPGKQPAPRFAVRGNEIVVTLLKAAVLAVLCYALM